MNGITLFWFLGRIGLSLMVTWLLWGSGAALSILGGTMAFVIFPALIHFLFANFAGKERGLPPCVNNRCVQRDDYIAEAQGSRLIYTCRCGSKFLLKQPRFLRFDSDGHTHPYMIWRNKDGWAIE